MAEDLPEGARGYANRYARMKNPANGVTFQCPRETAEFWEGRGMVDVTAEHIAEVEAAEVEGSGEAQPAEATVEELRHRAAELDIEGRSSMNKAQLVEAIAAAEAQEG